MGLCGVVSLNRGQSKSLKGNLELDSQSPSPSLLSEWRAVPRHTEMLRKAEGKGGTRREDFLFSCEHSKPRPAKEQQF